MTQSLKAQLRKNFQSIIKTIPSYRRDSASAEAISSLLCKSIPPDNSLVLSFYSMLHLNEIDTSIFNEDLIGQNRLVLPKVEPKNRVLQLYHIPSLSNEFIEVSKYGIMEPIPKRCTKIDPNEISTVIVPGLAFESHPHGFSTITSTQAAPPIAEMFGYYRLGRGGGYYDILLSLMKGAKKIGIAYREQAYEEDLPIESHDQPVDRVIFF